jgi:hypothetical protein
MGLILRYQGTPPSPSGLCLKTDIEQVGTTVYGLPLYHFRYKTGAERFEGMWRRMFLR